MKTGKAIDVLTDAGMPIAADFSTTNKTSPMMPRGGHLYGVAGEERAAFFTKVADEAGVECVFSTTAKSLLLESGAVAGVQCESGDGKLVDIKAKAVCLCSGGFLGSPEETEVLRWSRDCLHGQPAMQGCWHQYGSVCRKPDGQMLQHLNE